MSKWYVRLADKELGPISSSEVIVYRDMGQLTRDTLVHNGNGKWTPANRIKGLFNTNEVTITQPAAISLQKTNTPPAKRTAKYLLPIAVSCGLFVICLFLALAFLPSSPKVATLGTNPQPIANVDNNSPPVKSIVPPLNNPAPIKKAIPFDLQGVRIGDPLDDAFIASHKMLGSDDGSEKTAYKDIEISSIKITAFYTFVDAKLISVFLSFKSEDYDSIVAAYTQKFGSSPTSVENSTVTNRMSAKFENQNVSWVTDSGVFTIQKYFDTVTDGHASLRTPESIAHNKRKSEEKTKKLGSQL